MLAWLRDMEVAARKFNWSDHVLLDAAIGKLTNHAKTWYDNQRNMQYNFRTWKDLTKALMKTFYPEGASEAASTQLTVLKYDPNQPLQVLYNKIQQLAYFTHESLFKETLGCNDENKSKQAQRAVENTVFSTFQAKLPLAIQQMAAYPKPANSLELLRVAIMWDERMKAQKMMKQIEDKSISVDAIAIKPKNPLHASLNCHYCGRLGHIQTDCRTRQKDQKAGIYNGRGRGGQNNSPANRGRGRGGSSQTYDNQQQNNQQHNNRQQNYYHQGSQPLYYQGQPSTRGQSSRGRGRGGYSRAANNALGYEGHTPDEHHDYNSYHEPQPTVSYPDQVNQEN